jgi:H+/Cl- antiporter ClcA
MFEFLRNAFQNRRKRSFADLPDWMLAFLAIAATAIGGFYSYVLLKVLPSYIDVANSVPIDAWGWKGCLVTIIIGAICLASWHFGCISWRCNVLLRERWYK